MERAREGSGPLHRLKAGLSARAAGRALARPRVRSTIAAICLLAAFLALPVLARPPDLGLQAIPAREIGWIPPAYGDAIRRPLAGDPRRTADALPVGPEQVQLYYRFELEGRPTAPLAIHFPAVGGAFEVYVNGAPIFEEAEEGTPHAALSGMRSALLELDDHYFHARLNRVDVIVTATPNRALAGGMALGPVSGVTLPGAPLGLEPGLGLLTWLLAAAGVFALIASPLASRVRPRVFASLVFLAFALKSLIASNVFIEALGSAWIVFDRAALGGALLAAGAWLGGGRPGHWRRYAGISFANLLLFGLAAIAAFLSPEWAWRLSGLGLVASLAALGLAVASRRQPERALSPLMFLVVTLSLVAGFVAILASLGELPSSGVLTVERTLVLMTGAMAVLALIDAGLLLGRAGLYALREGLDLSALVRRQRQEIEEKSRALESETRRRTLAEERQRLVRDMHDGVGGQLVSLLVRVRGGRLSQDEIESELRTGLQDLRLIVDSMDSAGSSLENALKQFRDRAEPQVEAAGMALVWEQARQVDVEVSEPRVILNIFRWLQEALSNALRHSGASVITIAVEPRRSRLRISVSDDGIGLSAERAAASAGRGMANMKARAAELGGQFLIEPIPPKGTRLVLELDSGRLAGRSPA